MGHTVSVGTTQLCLCHTESTREMSMHGPVPIKLYLQSQTVGQFDLGAMVS
jgi:hypothetical protein